MAEFIVTVRVTRANPTSSTYYDARTLLDYVQRLLEGDDRLNVLAISIKEAPRG